MIVDNMLSLCEEAGIAVRNVTVKKDANQSPFLCSSGTIRSGTPLISVPYPTVLNAQTIRGDSIPKGLPPVEKMVKFLTRRGRLDFITAQSLWLATFLAARKKCQTTSSAVGRPVSFVDENYYPDLKDSSLFSNTAQHSPATERAMSSHVNVALSCVQFYAKRKHLSSVSVPSFKEMQCAYYSVVGRSLLLPLNGAPSAPEPLSSFLESRSDMVSVPSLIPLVDMLKPSSEGNCLLYTCAESTFLSPVSRRRVLMEVEPLTSRRVVVCASHDIPDGEVLTVGCEGFPGHNGE
ncbi:hypothetical protein AGDE_11030 [Angomonas deanei]|nr:hypothetical protein AGDE_11030 [Angomonas deanei]|eukprot:EPY26911.1 hypothetical protein AGDE_11030 [Angomonas deanei]